MIPRHQNTNRLSESCGQLVTATANTVAQDGRLRGFVHTLVLLALAVGGGNLAAADRVPLKVFLLVGQSNMQGHAHVRTLPHLGMDERTAPLLKDIVQEDGAPRIHDRVWISYLSATGERHGKLTTGFGASPEKIGPELTFGIYLQRMLDEPILIIKTAWGGKSLHTDFRSPSAGPFEFNAGQIQRLKDQGRDVAAARRDKAKATGHYYRLMIDHAQSVLRNIQQVYPDYDAKAGYELAGMVWFQGWNDMVDRGIYPQRDKPGGYDQYSTLLAHFIRDARRDLQAAELPVVIGVMGAGGPVDKYLPAQQRYRGIHSNFRAAMAAPAQLEEFRGSVAAVLTEKYWDVELTALKARDSQLQQRLRKSWEGRSVNRSEREAAQEQARAKEFTPRERKVLQVGISNQEYHYLGSGKVMAQIGKGFAEAMFPLMSRQP